jgi:hypothetical protein
MKSINIFAIVILSILLPAAKCKKEKGVDYVACACNATDVKYILKDISGTLSYYQYNNRWVLSYSPLTGNISNFFPCNTNQETLSTIIRGANTNEVFQVKLSGKVKKPCEGEIFGFVSGVTTFDYIFLDSLKRN